MEEEEISVHDLANLTKSVTGGEKINEGNIEEWINCDVNDSDFELLTYEQILGQALDPSFRR